MDYHFKKLTYNRILIKLNNGKYINAIKTVRLVKRCGLHEAVKIVNFIKQCELIEFVKIGSFVV